MADQVVSFISSLSEVEAENQRAVFLQFISNLSTVPSVEVSKPDGGAFKAQFYTGTPFKSEDFKLSFKYARKVSGEGEGRA